MNKTIKFLVDETIMVKELMYFYPRKLENFTRSHYKKVNREKNLK